MGPIGGQRFVLVKTLALTPTCKTTPNSRTVVSSDRAVILVLRNYLWFLSSTARSLVWGFSSVGAIQHKEAVIEEKGQHGLGFKSQFNFFKKEL